MRFTKISKIHVLWTNSERRAYSYTWYGLISLPPFSRMTKQIWGRRNEEDGGRADGRMEPTKGFFISFRYSDLMIDGRPTDWVSERASNIREGEMRSTKLERRQKRASFYYSSSLIKVDPRRRDSRSKCTDRPIRSPIAKMIRTQRLNRFPLFRQ